MFVSDPDWVIFGSFLIRFGSFCHDSLLIRFGSFWFVFDPGWAVLLRFLFTYTYCHSQSFAQCKTVSVQNKQF